MIIPGPSFVPLVVTENIDAFLPDFSGLTNLVGGVGVYGPAAAYALVWELGSRRLQKPGPKTMWSTNRNGERVILTKQAPFGYVGIHEDECWTIIREEIAKVDFSGSAKRIRLELSVAIDNASLRCAQLIRSSAPVDSGDLRAGIQMVDSDSLEASNAASDATLIL